MKVRKKGVRVCQGKLADADADADPDADADVDAEHDAHQTEFGV